ncbi:hypothetical protein [Calothrix sp. PCC 7507]|uniref:hypothetical protein n=1 Tax=Calothrix sp. PCC 7507 TaxID=99598 RepID=UPI00029EF8EA|nr:hypothetical protein [Calothrix sp. PCC 7507]AFY36137.1 hypothetical protein Cal7507_5822 [Calothrix sp. PCC 7507]
MKRIIVGTLIALPLVFSAFSTQASAAEIIVRPGGHRPNVVARRVVHQKWIPAHWENTRRGRHWVPGHYERV